MGQVYPEMTVLGLMSGTSLDGMDLVRARFFSEDDSSLSWELLDYEERAWPEDFRARLEAAAENHAIPASEFAALHHGIAKHFADFVRAKWPAKIPAELSAFPGQTLHHAPELGYSLQLGNAAVFATLTGLPTIGDFRSPDLTLGGQGAPLVPMADALLRRHPNEARALVNVGGIANLTLLPPGQGTQGVSAWDTGPGNILLDRAAGVLLNKPYDKNGQIAASGKVNTKLLDGWLDHAYFSKSPPKSTGREMFGASFLNAAKMNNLAGEIGAPDLFATLLELTVLPLARALEDGGAQAVYLSGGGAKNTQLLSRLSERLPHLRVETLEALHCPVGAKEALDFALLAYLAHLGRPVALSAVTGAECDAMAGLLSPPSCNEE
ncbi:anhydro-N-acetylmuramic acid kinase [bacterium]|nr:anhydro-N-acetylmuramic acid kinase [bacterium]